MMLLSMILLGCGVCETGYAREERECRGLSAGCNSSVLRQLCVFPSPSSAVDIAQTCWDGERWGMEASWRASILLPSREWSWVELGNCMVVCCTNVREEKLQPKGHHDVTKGQGRYNATLGQSIEAASTRLTTRSRPHATKPLCAS